MESFQIKVNYEPAHFREIYYRDGQGSIFGYKPIRVVLWIAAIAILASIAIYFFALKQPGISWLLVLGIMLILGCIVYAIAPIIKYTKWKNNIEKYLKELAQYKSMVIAVSENAVEVTLDSKTAIDKWENIKSVRLEKSHIIMSNEEGPFYFFPAKSMKPEEFEKLTEFIRSKVK